MESAVLGRVPREPKGPAREMRVIRRLMRNILESLQKLHSIGIVHRDIKPQNMIFNSRELSEGMPRFPKPGALRNSSGIVPMPSGVGRPLAHAEAQCGGVPWVAVEQGRGR